MDISKLTDTELAAQLNGWINWILSREQYENSCTGDGAKLAREYLRRQQPKVESIEVKRTQ